jgi:hypothetical protein
MTNVLYADIQNVSGETVTYAYIANDDGSTTSMTKETYDAQQASTLASELSNPSTPQAGE